MTDSYTYFLAWAKRIFFNPCICPNCGDPLVDGLDRPHDLNYDIHELADELETRYDILAAKLTTDTPKPKPYELPKAYRPFHGTPGGACVFDTLDQLVAWLRGGERVQGPDGRNGPIIIYADGDALHYFDGEGGGEFDTNELYQGKLSDYTPIVGPDWPVVGTVE